MTIVDIGANQGQSAMSFRKLFPTARLVSFEPNPAHFKALQRLEKRDELMTLHLVGLGSYARTAVLYVPEYRGKTMTGLASFDRSEAESWLGPDKVFWFDQKRLHLNEVPLHIRTFDEYDLNPDFMKIDVQGLEDEVVAGAMQTIQRCMPVLLVEAPKSRTVARLTELGYRPLAARTGYNMFFVPN